MVRSGGLDGRTATSEVTFELIALLSSHLSSPTRLVDAVEEFQIPVNPNAVARQKYVHHPNDETEHNMHARTSAITAGALALALVISGCSNDDDAADNGSDTMAPTTAAANDSTTTTMAEDDPADEATDADIVDTAIAAGDFTTLVAAVQAAGLEETLRGDGPFTVFAPTDEAFAALPEGTVDTLLMDPTGDLTSILTYHVVAGEVMAADVAGMDGAAVETVNGATFTVNVGADGAVSLTDGAGNTVNVVTTDITTSNGVIHVIDSVLMPG